MRPIYKACKNLIQTIYEFLYCLGYGIISTAKVHFNMTMDFVFSIIVYIFYCVGTRVGANDTQSQSSTFICMAWIVSLFLAISLIRWIHEKHKEEEIQMPKKRFTKNDGKKIIFDTKRQEELILWVNFIENELESKGYYNDQDEDK